MSDSTRRRVERLERARKAGEHVSYLIHVRPGETEKKALRRQCGIDELPHGATVFWAHF